MIGGTELIAAGFRRHGAWSTADGGIVIDKAPGTPGVYVFMLAGKPVYIGQTGDLHRRFGNYRRGDKSRRRVKLLIEAALAEGQEVSVLLATPGASEWNGLPVDFVAGVESGLIQALRPHWNRGGEK